MSEGKRTRRSAGKPRRSDDYRTEAAGGGSEGQRKGCTPCTPSTAQELRSMTDGELRSFYLKYAARYPTKEVGRLGQKINDCLVGESGYLSIEALWTVAALIAENVPNGDISRDDFIDAMAELAKRRSREFTMTERE